MGPRSLIQVHLQFARRLSLRQVRALYPLSLARCRYPQRVCTPPHPRDMLFKAEVGATQRTKLSSENAIGFVPPKGYRLTAITSRITRGYKPSRASGLLVPSTFSFVESCEECLVNQSGGSRW